MLNAKSPNYIATIFSLRKAKELHTIVENRLIRILGNATPELHPVKEVQGLAGGRNDLMFFECNGRSIVFEVFATASQVSRDLLILHKTLADIKIAVILDKEADSKVFDKFLKENPDEPFPFLFIGELFDEPPINAELKLREIINGDDEARLKRLRRAELLPIDFLDWCKKYGIEVFSKSDLVDKKITYKKVFTTIILSKLKEQGISKEKLRYLGVWLSQEKVFEYLSAKVDIGFNMFLYTDLKENFAVYSDLELIDLIRVGHNFSDPHILVSVNAVVYEIEEKYFKSIGPILNPERKISVTVGASQWHENSEGRTAIYSLPSGIKSIIILPPVKPDRPIDEYLDLIEMKHPNFSDSID